MRVILALGLALAIPAKATPPTTAPSGDLDGDGNVGITDLQCLVLVYAAWTLAEPVVETACLGDSDCDAGDSCRPSFGGPSICLPGCLDPGVSLGANPDVTCDALGPETDDCLGTVQKNSADLNCDGAVTNVDLQFMVSLVLAQTGGPGTHDNDADGQLNSCDPFDAPPEPPGALDDTFSGDGKVKTPVGAGGEARAMVRQPDGRIVVTGYAGPGSTTSHAAVRYMPDGSLDPSFGAGGVVTTSVGQTSQAGWGAALQADGRILLAGRTGPGKAGLVRLTASGSLDTTFGSGGSVTAPGKQAVFYDVVVVPTAIVAIGNAKPDTQEDFYVARYDSSGAPIGEAWIIDFFGGHDNARAAVVDAKGRILAAGWARKGTNSDFGIVRLNDAGLDPSFSGDGRVTVDLGSTSDVATGIAIQSDGRIVVAGYRTAGGVDFALTRLTEAGAKDTSFGSAGTVVTNLGAYNDYAFAVAVQADDRIVVCGYTQPGGKDFAVVRYLPDGALDPNFGSGGIAAIDLGGSQEWGQAIVVEPTGRLVVAGASDESFAAIRIWP